MSGWDENDAITVAITFTIEIIILILDLAFAVVYACIVAGCWVLGFGDDD